MVRVFLDDERPAPAGWVRTRTAVETIEILNTGTVTELSLDHDLGEPECVVGNGYYVLSWLEEQAARCNFVVLPDHIAI